MIVRKGMWVVHNNTIGILADTKPGSELGEFHSVDENGETVDRVSVKISDLRQAKLNEIPAKRIKGQNVKALNKLGYV